MKIIISITFAIVVTCLLSFAILIIVHLCGADDFMCGVYFGAALSTSLWYQLYDLDEKEELKP